MTDWEDLSIPTPDGESLHAYFLRPTNKRLDQNVTVLMFHGNAGNIGHRLPIAKVIQEHMGCHVLMLEYRGYGLSTGSPNERGLLIDAQTGLDYLTERAETRDTKIVIYGQSLGGAVSIQLVAKNEKRGNVGGLILENTFTSMRKLIPRSVHCYQTSKPRLTRIARSRQQNTWLGYVTKSGLVIPPYLR
jgi:fermentation-respiration switch protein FrsA (DUF1100 family)